MIKYPVVVYIAGPYRGPSFEAIQDNIRVASAAAVAVWALGAVALCPHMNTAHFDGLLPDAIWLEGDLLLLSRCDVVLTVGEWEASTGAKAEVEKAEALGIPIMASITALETYLARRYPEA